MKKALLLAAIAVSPALFAQTDLSSSPITKPFTVSANLPGACQFGQFLYLSGGVGNGTLFKCDPVNTWTPLAGVLTETFASPPMNPVLNQPYLFTDASSTGTCSGGGSSYALCVWNGSAFTAVAGSSTGLGDPGSNGIVKRTGPGTSAVALPADITSTLGYTPENAINKDAVNGYAGLDAGGKLKTSEAPTWNQSTTGNAATATALSANGSNCGANQYTQGVDASGNAEGCSQPSTSTLSDGSAVVKNNQANTYGSGFLQDLSVAHFKPPVTTVAGLPAAAAGNSGWVFEVTDAASLTDCTTGAGSTRTWCASNGTAWSAMAGSGGAGSVAFQSGGSTFATTATVNFPAGFIGSLVSGAATYTPDLTYFLTTGNDEKNVCKFVDATGTTIFTGSLASGCTALTTANLVSGSAFLLRLNNTCTTCALQVDGVPAVAASIKKADGTTDPGGAIVAGQFNWVMYDSSLGVFRLLPSSSAGVTSFTGDSVLLNNSASAGAVTATLANAAAHSFFGNASGSTGAPGYHTLAAADLPSAVVYNNQANTYSGGGLQDLSAMKLKPPTSTVAGLPTASSNTNLVYEVTDGASSTDCTTGSGSTRVWCVSNGTAWIAMAGSGGGSGYATVQTTGPGGAQPAPTSQTTQTKANFIFPLKAANNAGNTSTDVSVVGPCDPRKMFCVYDDFAIAGIAGPELTSNGDYVLQQFNGGSMAIDSPSVTGMYGNFTLATGASSQAIAVLSSYGNAALGNYAGTTFDYLVRFKLSATAQARMFLGFKDTLNNFFTNGAVQNGIAIAFDVSASDTNFMCVAESGGVSTRTSIGVAADTSVHTARIRSTTAGTVLCSIDGGSEVSVATHVPTVALTPFFEIDTTTSPADTHLSVDYWWHEFDISR